MSKPNLDSVIASLELAFENCSTIDDFNSLKKEFLGRDSILSSERKNLNSLNKQDKITYGKELNTYSKKIEELIKEKIQ